jgi:methionine-rich copper-binding protein CopC
LEIFIEHSKVSIKGNKLKKIILFLGLILIGSIILSGAVSAATIPVTNHTNAIKNAINSAHSGDTLSLAPGNYYQYNITVNKNLTITGPKTTGKPTAVIDAKNKAKIFLINYGVKVTLQYLLIQNGNATKDNANPYGGGIYNNGTLNIKNCTIQKNTATYGGGIYNDRGTVTVTDSNVNNNNANDGGGIYNQYGTVTVTDSNIYNNNAIAWYATIYGGYGAGIYNLGYYGTTLGKLNLIGSHVYNNNAPTSSGGGIDNYNAPVTVTHSNIDHNIADNGGGINSYYGTVTVNYSNIYNNKATSGTGGGVDVGSCTLTMTNCIICNNLAQHGGGISVTGRTATITNSNIYNNTATDYGTGWGANGGGINNNQCTLTIINSDIYNNKATSYGGGIYTYASNVNLGASRIFGNTAKNGNNVYNLGGTVIPAIVNSIDPANNAKINVANKIIKVTFLDPIKAGNMSIELKNSNGTNISISKTITGNVLTINHTSLLTNGKYTLILYTGSVTDLAGHPMTLYTSSFTMDSTPPKVATTTPTNGKTGVSRTSTIAIKFTENIKNSTYYSNIKVKNLTTGKYVTITKAISGTYLNIKTSTTRTANTWYTVTIPKAAIKDYAGNNLAANYTFKFKTGP